MKQHLHGMERAGVEHLHPTQYWDLNGKAAVETRHISETLIPASVNEFVSDGKTNPEEGWTSFAINLKTTYIRDRINPDPEIMNRARSGDYQREAPSSRAVITMLALFWLAAILEAFVFVLQALFGGSFNPVIILLAVLLATGAFLIGSGLGQILYRRWCVSYLKAERETVKVNIANIAVGAVILVTIAFFRAWGVGEFVAGAVAFVMTFLLGAICALFETLHTLLRNKRERLLLLQGQAQEWVADAAHDQRFHEYRSVYFAAVDRAARPSGLVAPSPRNAITPFRTEVAER
jgi:hypothetical protein